jgi:ketosteroid isomerase-like protein
VTDAETNTEIVRRAYEAFNTRDLKTLAEALDESASWHTPGRSPSREMLRTARRSSHNVAGMSVTLKGLLRRYAAIRKQHSLYND